MINHFPSYESAESHLVTKGFTQRRATWISPDGHVTAKIEIDPHRGVYILFREMGV